MKWQAAAAACMAPVFYDRIQSTPLLFHDGSEKREIDIPHISQSISDYGNNAQTASVNIAKTFWTKAEIIVIADSYEQILQLVPIASFLSAPILISPTEQTLVSLQTKCAIIVGETELGTYEKIILESKEDVWRFQIELFDTKGQECNYVVIANPYDTESNYNIKWKFQSLASAPLAAYRKALVQTGNYTGDRQKIDKIAKATKTLAETYEDIRPYFERVKFETYNATQFLLDNKHTPQYMALVGGSYAIPDYFFDYHIDYFYWGAGVDYVASTTPYASFLSHLVYEEYPFEDMGVGRIIGHSLLDSTNLLARTFFYKEYLTGGIYENLTPDSWEKRSSVIEGHRLNQPQPDGPPGTYDEPYFPAGDVDSIYIDAGFNETYYLPRNFTRSEDKNTPIGEILDNAFNSSVVLVNAHGGLPGEQALIEVGLDTLIGKEYLFTLDSQEAEKRALPPSIVYVIACETGATSVDIPMENYVSLEFLHSGAVAYIAPDTYQTICFWDKAPFGPEADQTISFFQNLLNQNMPIGKALSEAKWEASRTWLNTTSFEDDVAGTTVHLYGDPAFEPYKPQVPFSEKKQFDLTSDYNGLLDAGSSFSFEVKITELGSGAALNDAEFTIEFEGKSKGGNKATFEAPSEKGVYKLDVIASKSGYEDTRARYIVYVKNDEPDLIPVLLFGIGICAILTIAAIMIKKRK